MSEASNDDLKILKQVQDDVNLLALIAAESPTGLVA
jgi:hypothetical protein